MEDRNTDTQIAVMAEQIKGIQKDMSTLTEQMKSLRVDLRDGFRLLGDQYSPKIEVEDVKRRLDNVEAWQVWALRAVVGLVIAAVAGAVLII